MRIRIYTDGACSGNPGPGGWAVVVNTEDRCNQYSGHETSTTNNRMELMAIFQCLKLIMECGNSNNVYEVFSDSAYVVNSLNNGWLEYWKTSGWRTKRGEEIKNQDLWKMVSHCLTEVAKAGRQVKFIKIKGHAGNTFNELADKLARDESNRAQVLLRK